MPKQNLCTGTFWYWNADPTPAGIRRQLETMKNAGYQCVYIHPMPDNFRKGDFFRGMEIEYLGKRYFDMVRTALAECKRLGITLMLYDEGGWPSGGVVGKLVEKYPGDRIRYIERDGDGFREAVSGEPDLLSGSATGHFIEMVYERYKAEVGHEFGKTIRGIFTDEPFWRHSLPREQIPVPKGLRAMLKKLHGSDFDEILPLLFPGEDTPEAMEARRQYTDVCTRLMAKNYSIPLARWSRANNLAFEGHFDQDDTFFRGGGFNNPAKVIDSFDVPGVDAIWRQIYPGGTAAGHYARFAQMAAIRNKRREALCEIFQVYGYYLTAPVMNFVCNSLLSKGINRLLPMPYLYSDRGMYKISCSSDFSPSNPVWRQLPALNEFWSWAGNFNTGALDPAVWVLACTREFGGAHPLEPTPGKDAYEAKVHGMLDRLDDALVFYRFADDEDLKKRKLPRTLIVPGELHQPELIRLVKNAGKAGVEIIDGFQAGDFRKYAFIDAEPCNGIRLLPCRRREGEVLMLFNAGDQEQTLHFRTAKPYRELLPPDPALAAIAPVTQQEETVCVPLPPGALRILRKGVCPPPEKRNKQRITLDWQLRKVEQLRFSKDKPTRFEVRSENRPLPAGGMYTQLEPDFSGIVTLDSTLVSAKSRTAWLVFDDIRYGAELFANGKPAGLRAFAPWVFKIRLKKGVNRLTIKVSSSAGNEWRRCFRQELEPVGWVNSYGRRIIQYPVDDADCGLIPAATLFT